MSPPAAIVHVRAWSHGLPPGADFTTSGHSSTDAVRSLPKSEASSIASARTAGVISVARMTPSAPSFTAARIASASPSETDSATVMPS